MEVTRSPAAASAHILIQEIVHIFELGLASRQIVWLVVGAGVDIGHGETSALGGHAASRAALQSSTIIDRASEIIADKPEIASPAQSTPAVHRATRHRSSRQRNRRLGQRQSRDNARTHLLRTNLQYRRRQNRCGNRGIRCLQRSVRAVFGAYIITEFGHFQRLSHSS